ncbi:MAG: DUF262 domain-containing protein [Chloroflexi bacterium]|nr:DUF262 domain-containing protein [Chloroflexota bacterium]
MPSEARNRRLSDWMTRIRTRQTVLPRFQRFQAWSHSQVTQLFNTILQDLPCGALLVLEIGDDEPFISRAVVGAPTVGERVTEHLLDGQQRITAIWRGLNNDYADRTYFLYLQKEEETNMPYYVDSVSRYVRRKDNQRMPLWADNPNGQWQRRAIPLNLFAPGEEAQQEYDDWLDEAIENPRMQREVDRTVNDIRHQFANFNLPFLSLPVQTKRDVALDVFMRTNTSATPLSAYDIVVAQVEAGAGESLHDLVAETKEVCPAIVRYYEPESLILAACALLQRRVPSNATYLTRDFGNRLVENWEKYLRGVKRSAVFLEEERILDERRLPTDVVLPVLVALWAEAPDGLFAEGNARSALRKYLWRAFFTNRYERTTATRSLVDYNELKAYLTDSSASKPIIFGESLPEATELIEAGWPNKKDRLARAILALSLKENGLDLADGSIASHNNLSQREYHHLFPVAHLERRYSEIPIDKIYAALNCALVTWRTNRSISDKEPERYLTERRHDSDPDEAEVRRRLESHIIPFDEMVTGDYDAFLERRAELVHDAMLELCN